MSPLPLLLSSIAFAHPGGHGGGDEDYGPPLPAAVEAAPEVAPATYAEVVAGLGEALAAGETALEGAKVVDLVGACTTLSELGASIPSTTADLPEDAQATAATAARHLERQVAEALGAVKKGDLEGAKLAMAGVSADVDVLRGLAPKE